MALGELRGPMREETDSFLNRVSLGLPTQAATAAEAHDLLMLTRRSIYRPSAKRRCGCRSSRMAIAATRPAARRHDTRAQT